MARLIFEQGVEGEDLSVTSVGAAQWPNDSLGCPEPGVFYANDQAPYAGLIYVLSDGSNTWEYHTNSDDTVTVQCSEIEPFTGSRVNIALEANLEDSTSLTLMRRNFSTDQFEVRSAVAQDDLVLLAAVFDLETTLSEPTACKTIFRLDFNTPDGIEGIEFICEEDYKAFNIIWRGMMGRAPVVGEIIGPYLTGDLPPEPPGF